MMQFSRLSTLTSLLVFSCLLGATILQTGCASSRRGSADQAMFFLEADYPTEENWDFTPEEMMQIVIPTPVFTWNDISDIMLVQVDAGICLLFQLNERAANRLYQATVQFRGRRLVLAVSNEPIGIREIDEVIENGRIFIFLDRSVDETVETYYKLDEALQRRR